MGVASGVWHKILSERLHRLVIHDTVSAELVPREGPDNPSERGVPTPAVQLAAEKPPGEQLATAHQGHAMNVEGASGDRSPEPGVRCCWAAGTGPWCKSTVLRTSCSTG